MESFDNYRDSASQYGASALADDTASMPSGYTTDTRNLPTELESLSISGSKDGQTQSNSQVRTHADTKILDDDFDGVLDDLKDEPGVNLPPHACR